MKTLNNKIDTEIKSEMTANELLAIANLEMPSLLDPILPKYGVASLVGSSDTGKSSFLRQLALSIVQGKDTFIGRELNCKHNNAIYVSTEDEQIAVGHLLAKQLDVLDIIEGGETPQFEALNNLRFLFNTANLVENLDKKLSKQPADCIFIDAFSDVYSGSLNAANKVRTFLHDYVDLATRHQCLIIFLHHNGKRTQSKKPHKDNILGSQGFEGKMRAVLNLHKDVRHDDVRNLCIVKHNYLSQEDKNHAFRLKFDSKLTFSPTGNDIELSKLSGSGGNSKTIPEILLDEYTDILDRQINDSNFTYENAIDELNQRDFKVSSGTLNKAIKKRKQILN